MARLLNCDCNPHRRKALVTIRRATSCRSQSSDALVYSGGLARAAGEEHARAHCARQIRGWTFHRQHWQGNRAAPCRTMLSQQTGMNFNDNPYESASVVYSDLLADRVGSLAQAGAA